MIYVDQARCTGCGTCLGLCPRGAIALENGVAIIAPDLCNECRDCLDACPQAAIVLSDFRPRLWLLPAAKSMNRSLGTGISHWPSPLLPQAAMVLSDLRPRL